MRARGGPALWFITGGVLAFSGLDLVGLGAFTLLPATGVALVLLALRVPGLSVVLIGAGSVMSVLWGLHITSGDTPDSELWPVFLGLVLLAVGLTIHFRHGRANQAAA